MRVPGLAFAILVFLDGCAGAAGVRLKSYRAHLDNEGMAELKIGEQ